MISQSSLSYKQCDSLERLRDREDFKEQIWSFNKMLMTSRETTLPIVDEPWKE